VKTFVLSIGNTSLFAGVFHGGKSVASFRVPVAKSTDAARTLVREILPRVTGTIDRAALCSVVPKLTGAISRELQRRFGTKPFVLTSQAAHGLKIGYRDPRELGTDRLAAAIGARVVIGARNAVVVDCGTATTVTALRSDGVLLGGAIFPGLSLWPQMLASRTAQLPAVELRRPRVALGRSTQDGLRSGCFHGHAGAMRELVGQIRREAFGRREVLVIGTGGNAPTFSHAGIFSRFEPELVLVGLDSFARASEADRL
jgi:type III pantothenate kinase